MGHAAKTVTVKHDTAAALERDRAAVENIPLRWVAARVGDVPAPVPPAQESRILRATFGI